MLVGSSPSAPESRPSVRDRQGARVLTFEPRHRRRADSGPVSQVGLRQAALAAQVAQPAAVQRAGPVVGWTAGWAR